MAVLASRERRYGKRLLEALTWNFLRLSGHVAFLDPDRGQIWDMRRREARRDTHQLSAMERCRSLGYGFSDICG